MSSTITKRPKQTWLEYLSRLVWKIGNLDAASYDAFLRAATLGVPASIAIEEVTNRIRAAGDNPKPRKLAQQWNRATMYVKAEASASGPIVPTERPAFDPDYAKQIAELVPSSVDLKWIRRRSPMGYAGSVSHHAFSFG
jgi:hypothetical protein